MKGNGKTLTTSNMNSVNEEQIIHGYLIDGAMRSLGAEVIDGLFT